MRRLAMVAVVVALAVGVFTLWGSQAEESAYDERESERAAMPLPPRTLETSDLFYRMPIPSPSVEERKFWEGGE